MKRHVYHLLKRRPNEKQDSALQRRSITSSSSTHKKKSHYYNNATATIFFFPSSFFFISLSRGAMTLGSALKFFVIAAFLSLSLATIGRIYAAGQQRYMANENRKKNLAICVRSAIIQ